MERVAFIDSTRGISILLIVFLHVGFVQNDMWYFERFSFVVPLFFLLSAIFFNAEVDFKHVIIKKIDALIKPYFVVLISLGVMIHLRQGFDGFLNYLFGVFYGVGSSIPWTPMWFIPHLFLLNLVAWLIMKFINLNRGRSLSILGLITSFLVGYFFFLVMDFYILDLIEVKTGYLGLPFSFDFVFLSLFYFFVGMVFKREILNFKINGFYFLVAALVVVAEYYWFRGAMDFNMRKFDSFFSVCISSLAGIYLVFSVSEFLSRFVVIKNVLMYIGKISLFILMFHVFFVKKTEGFFDMLGFSSAMLWPLVIVISVLSCAIIYEITLRVKPFSILLLPKSTRS